MNDEHAARLADLEARVHALESAATGEPPAPDAGAILDLSPTAVSNASAALGHPTRLEIVRTLLRGPAGAAELQTAVGLTSPGQLYHHLRALSGARIVEQESRNHYRMSGNTPCEYLSTAGG
ncbi:MAG: ArsR family transcriptional regulator [Rhodococcus sp. (in: high G+C Gram-positive bacteria)]|nr:MAG: ArsR family transcriptional regulator [Rhodococcus sp. (in: high G+C Gram-positive bacteria)]